MTLAALPVIAQQAVRMGIAGMTHDQVNAILNQPRHEGMILVGFAEPDRELAMRLLHRANLPDSLWFPSLEKLIEKAKPDAICDFRSTFQHLETVEICAPRKIHVMVEKPLAVNMQHALKMEQLARQHGIHLITNYETTWYAGHYEAFDMIHRQGLLGELRKVVIMDGHTGPKEIGCSQAFLHWLTDPVMNGGGAIMDFGCYGADIMTWLMQGQKPLSVFAQTRTNKPEVYPKVDDEATIIVQYPTTQGIFQASWNWPYGRKDTEIYGQTGYIFTNRLPEMKVKTGPERDAQESTQIARPLQYPYNDPFSYFAAVVRNEINPTNDLGGLKINMIAMEILDAAVRSAKTGKVIKLK